MPKDYDTEANDWLGKFLKRMGEGPPATPEEISKNRAEREQRTPTKYRTISINEDGVIEISMNQFGPNGIRACGDHEIKPGEEYYKEAMRDYGYLKPGESHTIFEKLIDGKWVVQEPNHPDPGMAEAK